MTDDQKTDDLLKRTLAPRPSRTNRPANHSQKANAGPPKPKSSLALRELQEARIDHSPIAGLEAATARKRQQ
jgi:hypothetical protein